MAKVNTVKIKRNSKYVIINKSDFNPAIHELYVEPGIAPEMEWPPVLEKNEFQPDSISVFKEIAEEVVETPIVESWMPTEDTVVADEVAKEGEAVEKSINEWGKELADEDAKEEIQKPEKAEKSTQNSRGKRRDKRGR